MRKKKQCKPLDELSSFKLESLISSISGEKDRHSRPGSNSRGSKRREKEIKEKTTPDGKATKPDRTEDNKRKEENPVCCSLLLFNLVLVSPACCLRLPLSYVVTVFLSQIHQGPSGLKGTSYGANLSLPISKNLPNSVEKPPIPRAPR